MSQDAKEIFNQANAAFVDENYDEALRLYNLCIEKAKIVDPDMYIKRSACHMKLENYTGACSRWVSDFRV